MTAVADWLRNAIDPLDLTPDHVGVITRRGYLYCTPCARRLDTWGDHAVLRGVEPHCSEACDACGRILGDA